MWTAQQEQSRLEGDIRRWKAAAVLADCSIKLSEPPQAKPLPWRSSEAEEIR